MNKKLYIENNLYHQGLTAEMLQELSNIVEFQNTTDRNTAGDFINYGEYGEYHYTIDKDGDIILTNVIA